MVVITITSLNDLGKFEIRRDHENPTPDEMTVANEMLHAAGFAEMVPDGYEPGAPVFQLTEKGKAATHEIRESEALES